jgi:hypothetical protein
MMFEIFEKVIEKSLSQSLVLFVLQTIDEVFVDIGMCVDDFRLFEA